MVSLDYNYQNSLGFSDLAEVPRKWNLLISRTMNFFYKLKSFNDL